MTKEEEKTTDTKTNAPMIQINGQYIKDLSFEAPKMPFFPQNPQIAVNIDVNAGALKESEKLYSVELKVTITAKAKEETAFICELTYGAVATLNLPTENIKPVLLIEVPHLLFPYVRAIISNTVREAGLPPLSLNPIDFAALYRQRMAQEAPKKE